MRWSGPVTPTPSKSAGVANGMWETQALEDYIARMYDEPKRFIVDHPFNGDQQPPSEG